MSLYKLVHIRLVVQQDKQKLHIWWRNLSYNNMEKVSEAASLSQKGTKKPNMGRSRKGCMKGKGGPENVLCTYKGVRQRTWGKWVAEIENQIVVQGFGLALSTLLLMQLLLMMKPHANSTVITQSLTCHKCNNITDLVVIILIIIIISPLAKYSRQIILFQSNNKNNNNNR